jgi:hypothetical protein
MREPTKRAHGRIGPIEFAVIRRILCLWLAARIAAAFLLLLVRLNPLDLSVRGGLILVACVGTLSWIDTKRRNEDILLANLGTSPAILTVAPCVPPFVMELGLMWMSR